MDDVKLTRFALVRPIKTSFRFSSKSQHSAISSSHVPSQISNEQPRPKSSGPDNPTSPIAQHQSTNISVMQTLDRKISASSDQLDNLKRKKSCEEPRRARSSSRNTSDNKYQDYQSEGSSYRDYHDSDHGRERAKTPFEMFLEDDGPYSRRLYGPVTSTDGGSGRAHRSRSRDRQRSRERGKREKESKSRERLVYNYSVTSRVRQYYNGRK